MLDQATKRRIDNACDILVGKVPTPLAQVEQITLALIYKFMADMDKRALSMGGQASYFTGDYEKYSWDNLMDSRIGAQERADLYEEGLRRLSQHSGLPELFRGIFKEASVPFRASHTLNLFLQEIDGFSYEDSENLGDAYEYLLGKTGSQGEAGQFRTPRHIIDFIVQVVDPNKYDTILDPACGTAGFLISALKHIYRSNTKDIEGDLLSTQELMAISNNVYGYDITPDMVRISRVNMFLHNIKQPHIYEYDTLSSLDRWDETYSCILANPPFMTPKGGVVPHNRFSIKSTRSEVLFVDYILEHLTLDGKAGIIVPEGIIFQSGKAYKQLRKKLVEENYLVGVISLPSGVFNPYSGVKTSILWIDRSLAKRTDKIIFLKVNNDGFNLGAQRRPIEANDLPTAITNAITFKDTVLYNMQYQPPDENVIIVEKSEFGDKGDHNLSGERYFSTQASTSDYQIVRLSEVAEVVSGQSPDGAYYNNEGLGLPFYQGKTEFTNMYLGSPSKWTTQVTKRAFKNDIVMSVRAPVGPVNIVSSEICIGRGLASIRCSDRLNFRYCFYVLRSMEDKIIGNSGSTFASINRNEICDIEIPLPPLSVQEQIVEELDSYQRIIDGAKLVIDNWKPHIEIEPNWNRIALGDFCTFMTGGTPSTTKSEYYKNGNIPWLVSGDIHKEYIYECDNYISEEGYQNSNAKYLPENSVLIALNGQGKTRGCVALLRMKNATCNQSIVSILPNDKEQMLPEFLLYQLKAMYKNIRDITGDNQRSGLNIPILKSINVILPDLPTQQAIVDRIVNEQKLVDGNRQIINLYESKIQTRIHKLWKIDHSKSEE